MNQTTPSQVSLVSIQVGAPRQLDADTMYDQPWTTGIFKTPIGGAVFLSRVGLAGDGQADLAVHGGPDKAVCVYSADHYPSWRATSGLAAAEHGAFGENFTLSGLTEDGVCIGDTWTIGSTVVQVSQPRQPCWKLARKWRIVDLTDQVVRSGRTGWYFRVLQEGTVEGGTAGALLERPHPEWTVTRANRVMHGRPFDLEGSAALAGVAPLSGSWKATLAKRLAG